MAPHWKHRPAAGALAVLAAAAGLATGGCARDEPAEAPTTATVRIGDAGVRAELAREASTRARGLSGRDSLPPGEGMLFEIPGGRPTFWMKGMRFPIDIIWVSAGRVVDVTAAAQPPAPGSPLRLYSPRGGRADRALEVNAGWAKRNGVRPGARVRTTITGGAS